MAANGRIALIMELVAIRPLNESNIYSCGRLSNEDRIATKVRLFSYHITPAGVRSILYFGVCGVFSVSMDADADADRPMTVA